jgi:polyferredoxin
MPQLQRLRHREAMSLAGDRPRAGGSALPAEERGGDVKRLGLPTVVFAWIAALIASLASTVSAASRFPPPDFESGHTLPVTTTPAADPAWYAAMDVAVLIAVMGIVSYLVLRRRSRIGVLITTIFSLAYFGFWRQGCVCSIGSIQNVALAMADSSYVLPGVVGLFFALPIVFTLVVGRVFCAGACPLGALQDLVVLRPVRVPEWLETPLRMLRYIYLGLAVLLAATGSVFVICQYDPFIGIFRLSGELAMLIFGGALLVVGLFVARPYCRYLCPYGLMLGWLSGASKWHAAIDPDKCIRCRLCEDACPVNAIDMPTEPPTDRDTRTERRRLAIALLVMPVLIITGATVGYAMADAMSRNHVDVRLADELRADEAGTLAEPVNETIAYHATGRPPEEAYARADLVRGQFDVGTPIFGAFVGLVFALTWVQLVRRKRRDEYVINRSRCVSCARCFKYCPHDPRNVELLAQLTAEGKLPS